MADDPGKMTTPPPTHTSYLAQMLQDGKISQLDHDALIARYTQELQNTITNHSQDRLSVNIAGNVTISGSFSVPELHAASRVFNTVELLQLILDQLPVEALLVKGSLICKGFQNAIDNTPHFQRRLFRAPDYPKDRVAATRYFSITGLCVNTSETAGKDDPRGFNGVKVTIFWKGAQKFRLEFNHSTTLGHVHIIQSPTKRLTCTGYDLAFGRLISARGTVPDLHAEDGITVGHLMDWVIKEFRPRYKNVKDVWLSGFDR
ncbi:hypothetical protein LTR37_013840 [Vermiconidia calcicola]|uniref:Uncharacterized protein n=1 Tax=Vermiconidia calcicola TaxID=1690605 RepID=A0ACC3MWW2_9PEZI|nr:hypothetical protein LTR37_013840 [Vermiconidia calcicola]